jgi:hypothetical protein
MVSVRKNDFIETGIRPNNAINTDKTTAKGHRGFAGYLVRLCEALITAIYIQKYQWFKVQDTQMIS